MNDNGLPCDSELPGSVTDRGVQKTAVIGRGGPAIPDSPDDLLSSPHKPGALELGHFDVLETLGRGGFGVVVRAFDRKLRRVVAIKMMAAEMAAASPARKRFVREARAGAAVRHDNVVQVHAVEEHPTPYLVMEYVPGGSLQRHLDRTGPLDVREVLRLGAQVARGLAAAHETGLVHRDIKPANVLLEDGPSPRVKLTDFGLARAADDASLTQSGTVAGTPMYMAPEQARGEAFDHRADLYSLGSVLYVMVCGRPPFRAANSLAVLKRVAEEAPRPIREIIPETPPWLCDIIGKLHARKPENRFRSAAEVAGVLEKCLADLDRGTPVRPPVAASPARRRWKVAAAAVLAGAVVAGLAATRVPTSRDAPDPTANPPATTAPGGDRPDRFTNALGTEFVRVPAGTSWLGGGGGKMGDRKVVFAAAFYLGTFEVTHAEWEKVMGPGTDPSRFVRGGEHAARVADVPDADFARLPVNAASWDDCQEFLGRLNRLAAEPGWVYRLPRADEWEYACRGGPGRPAADLGCDFYAGMPATTLRADRANFSDVGLGRPRVVGSYPPNALGLHDLHGNAFELLDDADGDNRALAGGFWDDGADHARAASRAWINRGHRYNGGGLRVARVPTDPARP